MHEADYHRPGNPIPVAAWLHLVQSSASNGSTALSSGNTVIAGFENDGLIYFWSIKMDMEKLENIEKYCIE